MAAYQSGVVTIGVGIVIVTNITSNIHLDNATYHVKHTSRQCNLFEEWIKTGHQRDTNLCGACARLTDERSLVRGGGGYNRGSFVYFAKA